MDVFIAVLGSFRQRDQARLVLEQIDAVVKEVPFVRDVFISTTDDRASVEGCLGDWGRSMRVVQSAPPPFITQGHRLHQMLQLHNALEGLPDDAWVLKLRTDKLILPSTLITAGLRQVANAPSEHEGRFGVLEGHLFVPWFVNDMAFLGEVRSMKEIVSFDVSSDIFAPRLFTEQVIWSRLAGERRKDFFSALKDFPLLHNLEAKGQEGEWERTVRGAFPVLCDYWETLGKKFFSISNHRFRDPYPISFGGLHFRSDRVFSRYGAWGASFTDPRVVREIIASRDAAKVVLP